LDADADSVDKTLVDGEQVADDDDERLGRRAEARACTSSGSWTASAGDERAA